MSENKDTAIVGPVVAVAATAIMVQILFGIDGSTVLDFFVVPALIAGIVLAAS